MVSTSGGGGAWSPRFEPVQAVKTSINIPGRIIFPEHDLVEHRIRINFAPSELALA
jgi:hypothetical protein